MVMHKKTQEVGKPEKFIVKTNGIPNSNSKDNQAIINNNKSQAPNKKLTEDQPQKSCKNYINSSVMYSLELGVLMLIIAEKS